MPIKSIIIRTLSLMCLTLMPLTTLQASTHLVDLTYPYNHKTIYWPTEKGFNLKKSILWSNARGLFLFFL
jgi:hypothetical protein